MTLVGILIKPLILFRLKNVRKTEAEVYNLIFFQKGLKPQIIPTKVEEPEWWSLSLTNFAGAGARARVGVFKAGNSFQTGVRNL